MKKFCPQCGSKLPEVARFCPECGAATSGNSPAPSASPKASPTLGVASIVGLVALICVVFWIFLQIGRSHEAPNTAIAPLGPSAPMVAPSGMGTTAAPGAGPVVGTVMPQEDPRVMAIAARFFCRCGTCDGGDRISECGCNHPRGAAEVLSFIAAELAAGKSEDDVIKAVEAKYTGFAG